MDSIWRPKNLSALTAEQRQLKWQKDAEHEAACKALADTFYARKRAAGVTEEEEDAFIKADAKLWNDYFEWAKGEGLYEEVTPEKQLAEAAATLEDDLMAVNAMRTELGLKTLATTEK